MEKQLQVWAQIIRQDRSKGLTSIVSPGKTELLIIWWKSDSKITQRILLKEIYTLKQTYKRTLFKLIFF